MNNDWMSDARKIPDEVMNYIRRLAVDAIIHQNQSPEMIAKIFHISRSSIYEWLAWYRQEGDQSLDTRKAPGSSPIITDHIDRWLKRTVLHSMPNEHGYDTELWTLKILADLVQKTFGIRVYESTLSNHLHRIGLSCQAPQYRSDQYDPREVELYLTKKWPIIQKVAFKMGADIFFEDEAGVGIMTRTGRTWGAINSPPTIPASDRRGGFNVLSALTAQEPTMYSSIEEHSVGSRQYIAFLEKILILHPRPIVIVADHATFHRSRSVRAFVRKHRDRIRVFFLPKHAPQFNPDEQVWNEIKHRKLGREPIIDIEDLKDRLRTNLYKLKHDTSKLLSFFQLPDTKYVLNSTSS